MADSSPDVRDREFRREVWNVVDELEPVGRKRVAEVLYGGEATCPACNRYHDEFERHATIVGDVLVDMALDSYLSVDTNWNYRTHGTPP